MFIRVNVCVCVCACARVGCYTSAPGPVDTADTLVECNPYERDTVISLLVGVAMSDQ